MSTRQRLFRALSIFLGLLVLGAAVAVVLILAFPAPGAAYTEFYILGAGGKAAGYPAGFITGSEQTVVVGIVSHEREVVTYHIDVEADGSVIAAAGPIILSPQGKYEQPLAFTLESPGSRQKITFLLYKEGEPAAYRSVYLWVDVSPAR